VDACAAVVSLLGHGSCNLTTDARMADDHGQRIALH
jgi:hypothetical protein